MRYMSMLMLTFLSLSAPLRAQSPDLLETRVSLRGTDAPLEQLLGELRSTYDLHFSYVNNRIPLEQKITINVTDQPLRTVLNLLFRNLNVSYQLIGNQIVLKDETKPAATPPDSSPPPQPEPSSRTYFFAPPASGIDVQKLESDSAALPTYQVTIRPPATQLLAATATDKLFAGLFSATTQVKKTILAPARLVSNGFSRKKETDSTQTTPDTVVDSTASDATVSDTGYTKRPFQITLIYPLGTNCTAAGKVVNKVSVNLVGGYAAGLEGVEFGGFANVEKDYARGVQFAGFTNVVVREAKGIQFAGFTNVTGKDSRVSQFAGFANVNGGSVKAAQLAGFTNVTKGSVTGVQGAGFANVTGGSVTGTQLSGFLNYARRVQGLQLGIINIADSVSGVQVGLLSFNKHGYRRTEFWVSEALYANAAFKMGSKHFYNIFAVGAQTSGEHFRWGIGYGLGTEAALSRRITLNVDVLSYHVNENELWTKKLNSLNQLRALIGIRTGGRGYLFLGPTFNVMVSQYRNNDGGAYGSGLAPSWNTLDRNYGSNDRTNVKLWPGFNVGIRL